MVGVNVCDNSEESSDSDLGFDNIQYQGLLIVGKLVKYTKKVPTMYFFEMMLNKIQYCYAQCISSLLQRLHQVNKRNNL